MPQRAKPMPGKRLKPLRKRKLYENRRWREKARRQLIAEPLCAECKRQGKTTLATDADHVEPHKGNLMAFWNGKLQSLCKKCHQEKTARGG